MTNLIKACVIAALQALSIIALVLLLPLRLFRQSRNSRPILSLWTGAPIVNMAINARAERLLGSDSRSLVTHTYYITKAFDYDLSRLRAVPILGYLVPFVVFVWACLSVDRLHFYCDRGILPSAKRYTPNFLELRIYRLLGIDVFLWTYGADVRSRKTTQSLGEPNCCTDCTQVGFACVCDEKQRLANMQRLQPLSRAIFAMGDMIEYTPGSRNDLFFWPLDLGADEGKRYRPSAPTFDSRRIINIVHAPNHRMFKGTRFLEAAVRELKSEGFPVELTMVEKVPNARALELYRSADIIFDQCVVGFHGYFAIEGMALGKPVMCFIRKPAEYLLHPEECPIINTSLATLKNDLVRLINNPARLTELGNQGRQYVERHFTIEAFSRRLARAYLDLEIGVRK